MSFNCPTDPFVQNNLLLATVLFTVIYSSTPPDITEALRTEPSVRKGLTLMQELQRLWFLKTKRPRGRRPACSAQRMEQSSQRTSRSMHSGRATIARGRGTGGRVGGDNGRGEAKIKSMASSLYQRNTATYMPSSSDPN